SFFFFFQAEDGIRDKLVTGVQTCCSSDLPSIKLGSQAIRSRRLRAKLDTRPGLGRRPSRSCPNGSCRNTLCRTGGSVPSWSPRKIGRASCRERVEIVYGEGTRKEII